MITQKWDIHLDTVGSRGLGNNRQFWREMTRAVRKVSATWQIKVSFLFRNIFGTLQTIETIQWIKCGLPGILRIEVSLQRSVQVSYDTSLGIYNLSKIQVSYDFGPKKAGQDSNEEIHASNLDVTSVVMKQYQHSQIVTQACWKKPFLSICFLLVFRLKNCRPQACCFSFKPGVVRVNLSKVWWNGSSIKWQYHAVSALASYESISACQSTIDLKSNMNHGSNRSGMLSGL